MMENSTSAEDEKFEETLLNKIRETIFCLEKEWKEIELSHQQQSDRKQAVYYSICDLCNKILGDERCMKERIKKRIEGSKLEIFQLSEELNISYEEPEQLTFIELDSLLQRKIAKLKEERKQRFSELEELGNEDQLVCKFLDENPYGVPKDVLPTLDDLQGIKKHIQDMKHEKEQRIETYQNLRKDIVLYTEQLEKPLDYDLLLDIVCKPDAEILTKAYLLDIKELHSELEFEVKRIEAQSLELREQITSLWSLLQIPFDQRESFLATVPSHTLSCIAKLEARLNELKEIRRQNLSYFIEELRTELHKWWEKCYVGEVVRDSFLQLQSDNITEELLDAHEAEVRKWKKYYSEHSEILEKVDHLLMLFDNMQQLKERAKDPSRLFNTRGGALLIEEKERRRVNNELPVVQNQLIELCIKFETECGSPFLIDGNPVEEYISKLWDYHDIQREQEKNRLHNKNKLNVDVKKSKKGTNVASGVGSGKRVREEDDLASRGHKKVAKASFATGSATMFRSPIKPRKTIPKAPFSVPRFKPLSERNHLPHQAPFKAQLCSDDSCMQTSISYEKFKISQSFGGPPLQILCSFDHNLHEANQLTQTELKKRNAQDFIHSSFLQDIMNGIDSSGEKCAHQNERERKLRSILNLASPLKRPTKTTTRVSPVPGGAAGGAFLRRSASQPHLNKSPLKLSIHSSPLWHV